ncbi:MAG: glucose 1-dehydrogenase [Armatimonadetes bacterium]|nr:glucose 1-dehydrogenase [Armatimonadota bacterium]
MNDLSLNNPFDLSGRVAIVTGGGGGIGLEAARTLARAGADVAIAEIASGPGAAAADGVRALGRASLQVETDVRLPASVEGMVARVMDTFGRIDILVNSAGITVNVPAEEMPDDAWLRVLDVNLNGVFWCCRAVGRQMLARGRGAIVNIASMSGSVVNWPQPQAAYNASKAAVVMLTKSLAVEWAGRGVRVNSVSPGYIGTEMTQRGMSRADWREAWLERTPLGRVGDPADVARAVWYLASEASAFATGTDLIVDGGYTSC